MQKSAIAFAGLMLAACNQPAAQQPPQPAAHAAAAKPKAASLSVGDVLAWRTTYGDLLGKTKEAAVERFGQPASEDRPGVWTWDASPKTNNRMVTISFSDNPPHNAYAIKVYAPDQETLDPIDVLKSAPQFNFGSGTYLDSVTSYFLAETRDGRNDLQFDVGDRVTFSAAIFTSAEAGAAAANAPKERHRRR